MSVAELQHFFYGQFRHTIEYRLLKLAMRVEEDLGEDNDESLARYETPRGGKRKAAAQRKGIKRRQ